MQTASVLILTALQDVSSSSEFYHIDFIIYYLLLRVIIFVNLFRFNLKRFSYCVGFVSEIIIKY